MPTRLATLVRTGRRAARSAARLPVLYRLARELAPDSFTAEQTTELAAVRARIPFALARRVRAEVAAALRLNPRLLPLRLLSVQACGPVSLHDDKFRYPGVSFVIVVAHAGRLGIVDHRRRAVRHAAGEILLLDPYRRHALVPVGAHRGRASLRAHAQPGARRGCSVPLSLLRREAPVCASAVSLRLERPARI